MSKPAKPPEPEGTPTFDGVDPPAVKALKLDCVICGEPAKGRNVVLGPVCSRECLAGYWSGALK